MQILIFNFEYPPLGGGGGVATLQMAQELAGRHSVTVVTSAFAGLPRRAQEGGVQVVRVPVVGRRSLPTASLMSMLTFLPTAFLAGLALCHRQPFDVINAQFVIPSGIPAAAISFLLRIPLVVSFIGGDIYDPTKGISPHRHPLLRLLIRWIVRQAAICTAISSDTKRRVQQLHKVTKHIVVTHLGLLPAKIPPQTRAQLGLQAGVLYAISIGRLIPRKAYEVLLAAWRDIPDAQLLVIGDGPLREKLLKMIAAYGLQERVHVLGFVSDAKKQHLLQAADMYVSAAEHEGFGIVFLEAMDAGLPVVAANDGGQVDFLRPGENALLVEPHNPQALAEAIKKLLGDEAWRRRMGQRNRQAVQDFYLPKTVAKFEQVLLQAAHGQKL